MSSRLALVDTSAFIEFSRHPDSPIAEAVDAALADGRAAICPVVMAELPSGYRSEAGYRKMEQICGAWSGFP